MLKPKQKSIMFSILVGLAGFAGAYLAGHAGIPKESDILVAAREIKAEQAINASDLSVAVVPGKVPPTLVTKQELNEVLGKTVDYEIPAGVPISENCIAQGKPQRQGLYQDQVGVWVPVGLDSGGDVMPGDRVDIFADTNNVMTASGRPVLSYVRIVRAVDSSGNDLQRGEEVSTIGATPVTSPGVPAAVELALTSQQASNLAVIMDSGKLILALSPWPPAGDSITQFPEGQYSVTGAGQVNPQAQPGPGPGSQAETQPAGQTEK